MIQTNLKLVQRNISDAAVRCGRNPAEIKLIAVSKRFPVDSILEARDAGQILFGENYLQEAYDKKILLGDQVKFHFIGHLQSNKAKVAAEIFDMIETVDRFKIASALNRHLQNLNRTMDVLVQVNIGLDPGKAGVLPSETEQLLLQMQDLQHLKLKGLMTMPPFTTDPVQTRNFFKDLRLLAQSMQAKRLLPHDQIELSMGMSADYPLAIEEGATLIRIGTAIFGERMQMQKKSK